MRHLVPSGFIIIPGYENYCISPQGEVKNITTGRNVHPYTDTRGYMHVCLRNSNGIRTLSLHRLLMQTFKPCENMHQLTVDHLNGNPSDNRLDNLEWCTANENIARAAKKGLYGRKCPVETLNPVTGECIQYRTRMECAHANNLSLGSMFTRLASNGNRLFPEGLQYRYQSSNPRKPCLVTEAQQQQYGMHKAITLCNLLTEEIRHFSTIKDAMNFLGQSQSYFSTRYAVNTQPVLHGGWIAKLDCDNSPWRTCDYWNEWAQTYPNAAVIEVDDSLFLHRFIFAKEAASIFNLKITTVLYRVSTNGTVIFRDNTRWGYYPTVSDTFSSFA